MTGSQADLAARDGCRRALGAVALAGYTIHAGHYILTGEAEHALWACHIGAFLVGAGLLVSFHDAIRIGFLWLLLGNVLWGIDLAGGAELVPTSLLTHVVGLAVAIYAVRVVGWRRGTWWKATLALLALQLVTRCLTPAAANVNFAFGTWPGWEWMFPSHLAFVATLAVTGSVVFYAIGQALLRLEQLRGTQRAGIAQRWSHHRRTGRQARAAACRSSRKNVVAFAADATLPNRHRTEPGATGWGRALSGPRFSCPTNRRRAGWVLRVNER